MSSVKSFKEGCRDAIPIVLGYLPVGFAYGVLARQAGLPLSMVLLMSIIVFAGSAQFIGVSMIASGAASIPIIATTFLVNLRHLLMSASLSPHFKKFKVNWLPFLAFGLTDETFAVASAVFKNKTKDEYYVFGLNLTSYTSWCLGGLLGGILGGLLGGITALGLEFVLYAMFIFLLVIQLSNKKMIIIALLSGVFALIGARFLPGHWYIIIATILGATGGVLLEDGKKLFSSLSGDGSSDISA